ncbi:PAS domain S-box-containing protein [Desulfotomaculum arcticum]|uniref:PAS domain S-box-containing protein n=1 Tax=Desulfotruncus arcticus DSM 17038 TaxID=1121424 RepID=A0A1I2RDI4_9FIRM|nr:sigma-54-dependent Fis family transcriptional regulator [Desulfotruncus arcticus]SFG38774.1 PAS domain S-box-containing protein [Desulfotomaculum arcticum] [Desulfotruncus arcticus DSM 17038]
MSEHRKNTLGIEMLLDSIHEGVVAIDKTGRVIIFNQAAGKLMGIPTGKVIGRLVEQVVPNTRLHLILKTGQPELNQLQRIGENTIMTNRMPLKDEQGELVGAIAVFRDVSEIKKLAEEVTNLRETRAMLQAIISATSDAISVVDERGLGILINPAYTRLTGLREKDVINQPASVDIAEGESMHMKVLSSRQAVKNVPMKVGPNRREVLVDVAPILLDDNIKGSVAVIHDVSEIHRLSKEVDRARRLIRKLESKYTFGDIIGESKKIDWAIKEARKAAQTPATVLLCGESGTGKELFAHAIHHASSRRGQFIRVNCAAIPDSLLESELFGYVAGAFTGAKKNGHRGYFAEADKGTIFLDEIGEISNSVQAKLLRVLQEKEIVRLGDSHPLRVDVRVIAATNANLEQMVRQGQFREDLYYRLNVIPIYIPPLRSRRKDIPLIADFLLQKLNSDYGRNVAGISPAAMSCLMKHHWPGNVRELENVLGRALINMRPVELIIEPIHLSLNLNAGMLVEESASGDFPYQGETLARLINGYERQVLLSALAHNGGNKTRTAQQLGISIRSLYNKLNQYGLS